jgi:hypothetical protein
VLALLMKVFMREVIGVCESGDLAGRAFYNGERNQSTTSFNSMRSICAKRRDGIDLERATYLAMELSTTVVHWRRG